MARNGVLYAIRTIATWCNNRIMLRTVFSMRSVSRLYNEKWLRVWESLGTTVKRVGTWYEIAASLTASCEAVAEQYGREHRSWGSYGIERRYQAITGKDTTDWEDFVCAVVNCRLLELAIALQLLVITTCKCSINPVANPNSVYSYSVHVTICLSPISAQNFAYVGPVVYYLSSRKRKLKKIQSFLKESQLIQNLKYTVHTQKHEHSIESS
jgi:hypothetical protein